MGIVNLGLSDEEMTHLAEIATLALLMLQQSEESSADPRARIWEKLCTDILGAARYVPGLQSQMDHDESNDSWTLNQAYAEHSFYEDLLDEYQNLTFWKEIVKRVSKQRLEEEGGLDLPQGERIVRLRMLRDIYKNEFQEYGLSRFRLSPSSEDIYD